MRIYDGKYLSVTSVIELRKPFNSSSFKKWCESKGIDPELISATSSILGSKVSEYINDISRGLEWLTEPPVDDLESRLYSAVESFTKEWIPVKTEEVVYCDELSYAGRYDGIIEHRQSHKRYLADWKTYGAWKKSKYKRVSSKIKKARWQLSMYSYAMDWKSDLAVIVFKNDGTWELENLEYDSEMIDWVKDHQKEILETVSAKSI